MNAIKNFFNDEAGVTAIEYALMASVIGALVFTAATTLGGKISAGLAFIGLKIQAS